FLKPSTFSWEESGDLTPLIEALLLTKEASYRAEVPKGKVKNLFQANMAFLAASFSSVTGGLLMSDVFSPRITNTLRST
ncbi:hypothetical protein P6709_19975, partial [Jeotgalibacillus sp. ET6]|uniref:hypothetical protein n=1 Tax=Jeotgalibacillus sp. ET6 TaxID=3037260 RepID=UPI00241854C8